MPELHTDIICIFIYMHIQFMYLGATSFESAEVEFGKTQGSTKPNTSDSQDNHILCQTAVQGQVLVIRSIHILP